MMRGQALRALVTPTAFIALLAPAAAHAIEEPAYAVERTIGAVEVRNYAPYVVAEVVLPGSANDAGNDAFRILAGYIFGKNKGDRTLAMTAPVTQAAAPVKLDMTAPVTQTATPGGWIVQFVLPRGLTRATAPEPLDDRVMLRDVPSERVAVIRYSGTWSQSNFDEHLAVLRETLRSAELTGSGEPLLARYDPPFMPWFLRRNEIWLTLAGP